jgi:hypothetical protein
VAVRRTRVDLVTVMMVNAEIIETLGTRIAPRCWEIIISSYAQETQAGKRNDYFAQNLWVT